MSGEVLIGENWYRKKQLRAWQSSACPTSQIFHSSCLALFLSRKQEDRLQIRGHWQSEVLQTKLLMETSIVYIMFVKHRKTFMNPTCTTWRPTVCPTWSPKTSVQRPENIKAFSAIFCVPSIRARWKEVDVPGWSGEPERTGSPQKEQKSGRKFRLRRWTNAQYKASYNKKCLSPSFLGGWVNKNLMIPCVKCMGSIALRPPLDFLNSNLLDCLGTKPPCPKSYPIHPLGPR